MNYLNYMRYFWGERENIVLGMNIIELKAVARYRYQKVDGNLPKGVGKLRNRLEEMWC